VSALDIAVIVLGLVAIAGELWFFLGSRRPGAPARRGGQGVQEVTVTVKGGYDPDTILVEAGRAVRLHFYRDETADCSERIVFEQFGIDRPLPPFQTTTIEFTPQTPGDYPFRCGMSMMRGRVVAQVGRDQARANLGKAHAAHGE